MGDDSTHLLQERTLGDSQTPTATATQLDSDRCAWRFPRGSHGLPKVLGEFRGPSEGITLLHGWSECQHDGEWSGYFRKKSTRRQRLLLLLLLYVDMR